jgi:hypothetical protein
MVQVVVDIAGKEPLADRAWRSLKTEPGGAAAAVS